MVTVDGVATIVTELVSTAFTDRVADTDSVTLPLVPVMVKVLLPSVVEAVVLTVSVLLTALAPRATEAGLKLPVVPDGSLLVVRATVPVNPFNGVTETV